MNLILERKQYREDGIFGILMDPFENELMMTLEHAYPGSDIDQFKPKIPAGAYACIRGWHQLAHMPAPFQTFEVTEVKGHTNLLFHWGNYNHDSDGCILVGEEIADIGKRPQMITNSRATFEKFMNMQNGVMLFSLLILS